MANKRIREFRNYSQAELLAKVRETEKNLFDARMKMKLGQLEDVASVWRMRKDLARLKMLLGQKQKEGQTVSPAQ